MAGMLEGVDKRTRMVGQNRLELLLFRLTGKQRYGINVFKVQEVVQCPHLTHLPGSHPAIRGVTTIRGKTIPVIDLGMAIGSASTHEVSGCYVIVTEYNRSVQGLLVHGMDRIVNMNWEDIRPPPSGAGSGSYLTAVTQLDEELIEILDVEKVFAEVVLLTVDISEKVMQANALVEINPERRHVLVADDSVVARNQIKRTMEQIGMVCTMFKNGKEALDTLREWAKGDGSKLKDINMLISDIEMPEMDGYTLTSEIRRDDALKHLYVILHTSLSGMFNGALVEKVGANKFIAKFNPDELAMAVLEQMNSKQNSAV